MWLTALSFPCNNSHQIKNTDFEPSGCSERPVTLFDLIKSWSNKSPCIGKFTFDSLSKPTKVNAQI